MSTVPSCLPIDERHLVRDSFSRHLGRMNVRLWLYLVLTLLHLGAEAAQPPADGIQDETHALSDASHVKIASEMAAFRRDLGYDIWLTAQTFIEAGKSLRVHARETRQAWSGNGNAALLAYDRAGDNLSISFSPGIWDLYPSAQLIHLLQQGGLLMADKSKPPEQRLRESMYGLIRGLRTLEKERVKAALLITPDHARLAMTFGLSLLGGASLLLVLGILVRRRDVRSAWQSYFPTVSVPTRLGAPCGGGVTVTWQESRDVH